MSVLAPPETNRPQSAVTMETDTSMLEKEATARSTPVDSVHDEKPAMTEIAEVPEQEKDLTRIQTHESAIEYPKKLQLALITLALCLAVFLFALVCQSFENLRLAHSLLGSNDYCNCHPSHHRSIQFSR
jgi:hypothetical protein